jgi:peptidoglycan/xylan/chitin deacetylase (PgdA/CDA1 family)
LKRQVDPRIWWRYPPFMREAWARRVMVMFWAVLLTQVAMTGVVYMVATESRSTAMSGPTVIEREVVQRPATPEPEVRDPYWIEEPHQTAAGVQARAAAGDEATVIMVDGSAKAYIPAGESLSITLPASMGPRTWTLQPARLHRESERWTWGDLERPGISQVPAARGIAITFDGGWRADHADEILGTLREHGERATFFLTGQFLQNHPETTRRIVAAGHEVANHTWSHPHLTTFSSNMRHQTRAEMDRQRLQWELLRTEQLFYRVTGQSMAPMWRAPYGEINEEIEQWATELGYRHVGWTSHGKRERSLDTLDWVSDPDHHLFVSGEDMAERIVRLARSRDFSGGIVLMHLGGYERPDPVHRHLGGVIRQLRDDGIPTMTVSELLRSKKMEY